MALPHTLQLRQHMTKRAFGSGDIVFATANPLSKSNLQFIVIWSSRSIVAFREEKRGKVALDQSKRSMWRKSGSPLWWLWDRLGQARHSHPNNAGGRSGKSFRCDTRESQRYVLFGRRRPLPSPPPPPRGPPRRGASVLPSPCSSSVDLDPATPDLC